MNRNKVKWDNDRRVPRSRKNPADLAYYTLVRYYRDAPMTAFNWVF